MLILTDDDIREDIRGFERRIQDAKDKLAALPEGYLPYQEHKKREKARRVLEDDVAHVRRIIHIAEESLIDV
jgi:hypothetical protein